MPFGVNNHNLHVSTEVKQHWFKILKEGENLANLSEDVIRERQTELGLEHVSKPKTLTGYRRLDSHKVAPTMMFGNTCLPIHPTEARNLSVREAATIQGFPLDFIFLGGISAQYKQVGNAVPPSFAVLLAEHIGG
jgi:DNA (cytosine-5)-methyltransferase 1